MTEQKNRPLKIAIVAGEPSGDNLGASLIRALKKERPATLFSGIGGPGMAAEGFRSLYDIERLSVNGLPFKKIPELISILFATRSALKKFDPDCFIGIDYNFFNGFLEGLMKGNGTPTAHYVSPSVWAWRSGRIRRIKQNIDLMLTLYPFESEIYKKNDIPVRYVGHPKALEINPDTGNKEKRSAREILGFSPTDTVVAVLPGSRASEVSLIGPVFFHAAKILSGILSCKFVVPATNPNRSEQIKRLWESIAPNLSVVVTDNSMTAMKASDTVLVKSGTATLEAMLLRRPMVVAYRLNELSYKLVSRFIKTQRFALPNILADKDLVPEFIQHTAKPEILARAIFELLREPQEKLMSEFDCVHKKLSLNSGHLAADEILKLCERKHVSL